MATRDLWHLSFARLMTERAPRGFEVHREVPLSTEPQRADLILIRRSADRSHDEEGGVLRRLWPMLPEHTLVEFKSPVKGYGPADLLRLASYGAQLHALLHETIDRPADLALVLVIPSANGALGRDSRRMGWQLTAEPDGYGRIEGGVYTLHLVVTDDAAEAEADDFLRIFSHHRCKTREAAWWWRQWTAKDEAMESARDIEGYEEMLDKFVESLTPEERVRGLSPEQLLLTLPDEMLRVLPGAYLATFPAHVQEAVRKRLAAAS